MREELNVRVSHKVSMWIRHAERLSEEQMMKGVFLYYKKQRVHLSVPNAVKFSIFFLYFVYVNIELNLSSD